MVDGTAEKLVIHVQCSHAAGNCKGKSNDHKVPQL